MEKVVLFLENPPEKITNQLVFIVYGERLVYHDEVKLSILSLMRHTKQPEFTIRVMTDRPQEYEGWPVEVLFVKTDQMSAWKGHVDYSFRIKAMGILSVASYAEKTIFIDTDTFFLKDANSLFASFQKGEVLVDEIERDWKDYKQRNHIKKIAGYLIKNNLDLNDNLKVLNSGVLGVHYEDKIYLEQAIKFIDELRPVDPDFRELEQFAYALVFDQKRTIIEQKIIQHYFSKKVFFNEMMKGFFKKHGKKYTQQLINKINEFPLEIKRPSYFKRLLLQRKIAKYPEIIGGNLLKILYLLEIKKVGYVEDQALAYWISAMINFQYFYPEIYAKFQHGQWPEEFENILNAKQIKTLFDFLNEKGILGQRM